MISIYYMLFMVCRSLEGFTILNFWAKKSDWIPAPPGEQFFSLFINILFSDSYEKNLRKFACGKTIA